MKTKNIKVILYALILTMVIFTKSSFSTIRNVSVANFSFTPATISATVGDTIKWTWNSGGHTTTCDGSNGTTRPSGAAAWDADLNSGSPVFSYVIRVAGTYNYVCVPHSPDMAGQINAIASSINQLTELVRGYELSQNFPNPFNPATNIKFSIQNSSNVSLKIYNVNGQEVESLVNERLNAGSYQVDWNAVNFNSGVYYYKIQADGFIETRKMLLIK